LAKKREASVRVQRPNWRNLLFPPIEKRGDASSLCLKKNRERTRPGRGGGKEEAYRLAQKAGKAFAPIITKGRSCAGGEKKGREGASGRKKKKRPPWD